MEFDRNNVFPFNNTNKIGFECNLELTLRNTIQNLVFDAVPDSGTRDIVRDGETTAVLAYDDDATAITTAMEALVGTGNVTVTGDYSAGFDFEFVGDLASVAQAQMTIGTNALLDGTTPVVETFTTTQNTLPACAVTV